MLSRNDVIYGALNQAVLDQVPPTSGRVLDVGCGSGALGQRLKEKMNCHVTGITNSESEAVLARKHLDRVLVCDLNNFAFSKREEFDCVICSHVLEHLYRPDEFLQQLRSGLGADAKLIVALPNVLYWRQRLRFLRGSFAYAEGGLMDRTHYRFFDWVTAQELLTTSGYTVLKAVADGGFPLSRLLLQAGPSLDRAFLKILPGLFGFQFIFVCRQAGNPHSSQGNNILE